MGDRDQVAHDIFCLWRSLPDIPFNFFQGREMARLIVKLIQILRQTDKTS